MIIKKTDFNIITIEFLTFNKSKEYFLQIRLLLRTHNHIDFSIHCTLIFFFFFYKTLNKNRKIVKKLIK